MDLTLDQLLASLQSNMTKSAEEGEDKKDEKEDKDEGGKEKNVPPWLKDKEGKGEDKKDEKEDKGESKEDKKDEGQEKSASEAGAALAREIMTKAASINLETPEMNKQAQLAGKTLADALLANLQKQASVKKASAGDVTVTDGSSAPGTVPNKIQADVAQANAEGESYIKPMLTGDGVTNQGSINEIFDAMVQDAISQGAASEEQVHGTGLTAQEGAVEDHAVPSQVKTASEQEAEDAIEKAAAISELVAQGIDFSDAVELVKQAAVEIEFEIEKAAAMTQLMAEGVDFDSAIELVKQASAGDVTVTDGSSAPGTVPNKIHADVAQANAEGESYIKPMLTGDGVKNQGSINQIFDAIVQDAVSQGAASEEQVHDTGLAKQEGAVEDHAVPSQVKVAAINRMVEAGVDFDEAVEFVKQASDEAKQKLSAGDWGRQYLSAGWAKSNINKQHGGKGISVGDAVGTHIVGGLRRGGRALLEGTAGAGVGGSIGAGVGALTALARGKDPRKGAAVGAGAAGYAGYVGGVVHGGVASMGNQLREFHAEAKAHKKEASQVVPSYPVGESMIYPIKKPMGLGKKLGIGAGVAGAVGLAGAALMGRNQEKKAAFDALVEAGVDFDQAAILVSQKAQELYGE